MILFSRSYFFHLVILVLFFSWQTKLDAKSKNNVPAKIDSASIQYLSPTKTREEKVFSDPKLNYERKLVERQGFFDKFLDWLAEKLFGNAGYGNVTTARNIVIWTIVVVSLIIVIWLLWQSELVSLIRSKPKAISFNFSDITEDLSAINFDERIKAAVSDNDLRLAIRWHYLKILYLLDLKKIIAFAPYKTNIDYGNELKGKSYQPDFKVLSRLYDYVWYGKFNISEKDYQTRAEEFGSFEKNINVQGQ